MLAIFRHYVNKCELGKHWNDLTDCDKLYWTKSTEVFII